MEGGARVHGRGRSYDPDPMEHLFGRAAPFALGVEEELLLVDAGTRRARARREPARPAARRAGGHGDARRLRGAGRDGLADQPQRDRGRALAGGAARRGARQGRHADRRRHPPRRRRSARRRTSRRSATARSATRCAGCCGARRPARCTCTSGCPTPRRRSAPATGCAPSCRCCRRSPPTRRTGTGIDSGFATARAQLFRGYPRADIPRAFADWEDYEATMGAIVAAAGVADYTFLWWDIRPHPKLGTLEVRAMDAQARLGSVCGLAALVHGLAHRGRARPTATSPELPREVLVESSFRAGRDGLDATIWHDGALRPVRELAAAARRARARPTRATSARRPRSRRSSGSCATATARSACARPTPRAGWRACSSGSSPRRPSRWRPHDGARAAQRPAPARRTATTAAPPAPSRRPSPRCSTCGPRRTPCS